MGIISRSRQHQLGHELLSHYEFIFDYRHGHISKTSLVVAFVADTELVSSITNIEFPTTCLMLGLDVNTGLSLAKVA